MNNSNDMTREIARLNELQASQFIEYSVFDPDEFVMDGVSLPEGSGVIVSFEIKVYDPQGRFLGWAISEGFVPLKTELSLQA